MPGSIGSQSFPLFHGVPSGFGMRLDDITRPGAPGVAFLEVATRSKPYQIETLSDSTSAAGVLGAKLAYEALKGTVVTVVDGLGNSHANHVVLDVEFLENNYTPQMLGGLVVAAGGEAWYLRARWTLQAGGTP